MVLTAPGIPIQNILLTNIVDVLELATLTADISGADLERRWGDDNREYYVVDFDIEMKCFAAKIEFTPVYRGTKFKPAKIDFQSDST